MPHGAKYGGRVKGKPNKVTTEFKGAVNAMLIQSSPNIQGWLNRVAKKDPGKALDLLGKLAEYCYPKLARNENETKHSGHITFGWKQ